MQINLTGKKGQITLFVILGIVLIIGVLLFVFLSNSQKENSVDKFNKDVTTSSTEFRPIQTYVENCIHVVGRNAIDLIGSKGGDIEPFSGRYVPAKFYDDSVGDNDGVLLGNTDDSFVPFWIQSTTPVTTDKIKMKLDVPTIDYVSKQIEDYVDEHLGNCLNNLSDFEKLGYNLSEMDSPKTEVKILDEEVIIKTEMKTIVSKGKNVQEFKNFLTREPVPLGKFLFRAKQIVYEEYKSQYLENLVMQLIGFYGRIDSKSLPPISQTNSNQATVIWTQHNINEQLKSLLDTYIPLFRFERTKNAVAFTTDNSSLEQEMDFYNSFLLKTFLSDDFDIEVNHLFLHNDIYSNVNSPTDSGETITVSPESNGKWIFKSSGVESVYNFYYDVTYPVVVEITENNLSDGSTYTFMFAMEANIRNNRNGQQYLNGEGPIPWNPASVQVEADEATPIDELITDGGEAINLPPLKSFFNDKSQRLSGNITINTYDIQKGEPISGVEVQVGIGDYASINLGTTKFNVYGDAQFKGTLPLVKNGFLILDKEGYNKRYVPITTTLGQSQDLGSIGLDRICSKQLSIKVIDQLPISKDGDAPTISSPRNLTENEEVFVLFTKIPSKNDKVSFSTQATVNSTTGKVEVDLVPGKYEIYGMLIDSEGVVVPEKSKDICADEGWTCSVFTDDEDQFIPKEPIKMKPAMWGGIDFTKERPWLIRSKDACSDKSYLELHILKFKPPVSIDSLEDLGKISSFSEKYRANLLPQIINITTNDPNLNGGD